MTRKRFFIQKEQAWTDCECPDQLCKHENGQRLYDFWVVVDGDDEDAPAPDFDIYMEAKACCDRLNAERS